MIELFAPDILITSRPNATSWCRSRQEWLSLLFESFRERSDYKPSQDFQSALSAQLSIDHTSGSHSIGKLSNPDFLASTVIDVGEAIHNRDIQQRDESARNFEAVGPVPVIHIHTLNNQPHGQLVINLESENEW